MTRPPSTAIVLLMLAAHPRAHTLDEYLQAARLSLEPQQITLELDLTPGVAIASGIVAVLDRDADHRISPLEARTYAQKVLSDLFISLDGRAVGMVLESVQVSTTEELRDGIGTIRLRASGAVEKVTAGKHQLNFRNNHRSEISAYLVNALVPAHRTIHVTNQSRDSRQREAAIQYSVGPRWSPQVVWPVTAIAMLSLLIATRRGLRAM